jgi:hypothetical protein
MKRVKWNTKETKEVAHLENYPTTQILIYSRGRQPVQGAKLKQTVNCKPAIHLGSHRDRQIASVPLVRLAHIPLLQELSSARSQGNCQSKKLSNPQGLAEEGEKGGGGGGRNQGEDGLG